LRREFTFKQEELRDLEVSQLLVTLLGEERLEGWLWLRHSEPCQRQVRSEGARLAGEADLSHRFFDLFGELTETGGRLDPYPEYSRAPGIGKEAETLQSNRERLKRAQILQGLAYVPHLWIGNLIT
jgi:hypothetical protein